MFISGGIGITPNQSLYNQMVLEQENVDMKRDIRKVGDRFCFDVFWSANYIVYDKLGHIYMVRKRPSAN